MHALELNLKKIFIRSINIIIVTISSKYEWKCYMLIGPNRSQHLGRSLEIFKSQIMFVFSIQVLIYHIIIMFAFHISNNNIYHMERTHKHGLS